MKNWILTAFVITASSLMAQTATPPAPPTPAQMATHQVNRLTTLLTLTTAQQTTAISIFTAEYTALDPLRANMQTAHTALQTAITTGNQNDITAAATQLGSLTTQQIEAQAKGSAAFYAILTPDQRTKYAAVGHGGFGPGGPGRGPGGPGGHGPGPH